VSGASRKGGWLANKEVQGEMTMKAMKNLVAKLVRDEQGGEVLEYALIAGLIVVAAIAVIGSVGTKVLARWNSLNASM
jgi:Flp pilus assembly pilin Flp